jgi:hypothetical protein
MKFHVWWKVLSFPGYKCCFPGYVCFFMLPFVFFFLFGMGLNACTTAHIQGTLCTTIPYISLYYLAWGKIYSIKDSLKGGVRGL